LEKSQKTLSQFVIISFNKFYDKREQFVLELVKIFTETDIPFEKIQHFQSFLQEHCKYDNA
ncbi:21829_t:CDS:1, partial [Cetraspora pellucida]